MPSDGRWRHIKIVEKPASKAQQISGGIKNALSRGETLAKAKQSFINGGYSFKEVEEAALMVKSIPSQIAKPLIDPSQPKPAEPKKSSSKKIIIITSIVGAVILVIALVLGLFWNKIF